MNTKCHKQHLLVDGNRLEFVTISFERGFQERITSVHPRGTPETDMSETKKTEAAVKPDLKSHYRPLGLKAVAAAAMMLARKPEKPKAA